MRNKTIRKCSLCRMPGHTKRTCERIGKASKKTANSRVIVRVAPKIKKSPYVVDLRNGAARDFAFKKAPVYSEKISGKKHFTAKEIDFAEAVRRANDKENFVWKLEIEKVIAQIGKKSKQLFKQPLRPVNSRVVRMFAGEKTRALMGLRNLSSNKQRGNKARVKADESDSEIISMFDWRRFAYQMAAFFLIVAVPIPAVSYYQKLKDVNGIVVEESTNAFMALQASTVAALQSDIGKAEQDLNDALRSFGAANSIIEKDYRLLLSVAKLLPVVGAQVSGRQHLLVAGHHLALGNTYLVKGVSDVQNFNELGLTERLDLLRRHLNSVLPQYNEALEELNQVDVKVVPGEYQASFSEFKLLFAAFVDDMNDLIDLAGAFNVIFGDDSFKRYLVIFQNNRELRPTGGFMGSFAVVDIQKGKILNIDIPGGGTYDLKGQLTEFVKPPLPYQILNKRWEFQDANWFPDFAASAEKIEWFYQHSRGATVDGVISINASVLERLLKVIGPLENDDYDLVVNHKDVLDKLQYEVEVGYDKEINKPKAVLASLMGQLMNMLNELDSTDIVRLLTELHEALEQKEVQVYMNDSTVQEELRRFGWTGEITPAAQNQDYLMVVHANVQGQKSDAKIKQTIFHQAEIQDDGSIIDTVMIERAHTGTPGERFYGAGNISYVRVYVPEGAELIDAGGFTYPPEEAFKVPEDWYGDDRHLSEFEEEYGIHVKTGTRITKEFGKTVFGNWVITPAGQTSQIYFIYKLPFDIPIRDLPKTNIAKWQAFLAPEMKKEVSRYSLFTQKQSGVDSNFSLSVIYPEGWMPVWRSDDSVDFALNGVSYESILKTDGVIGVIMEKELNVR